MDVCKHVQRQHHHHQQQADVCRQTA
jgi:hypothetical protein